MAANNIVLYMDQGATFSTNVAISDSATANVEIDLADYSARSKMKKHFSSANSHTLTATIHANDRIIVLSMNATSTANVTDGRYMYDVEVYSANTGYVYRTHEGLLVVTPQITT